MFCLEIASGFELMESVRLAGMEMETGADCIYDL